MLEVLEISGDTLPNYGNVELGHISELIRVLRRCYLQSSFCRKNRLLLDASFLISAIRSCDPKHIACYSFFRNQDESTGWVVPTIAYFEYQATQSRLRKEGKGAYREIYIPNVEVFEISADLMRKTAQLDLANVFDSLRGADLVYACISKIEGIPLVTCDRHFERYGGLIAVINPVSGDLS